MSLRELIEPDCVGVNPLMRLRGHILHDVAHKDEGISRATGQGFLVHPGAMSEADRFANEFNQQMQPNTFRMDTILHNMHGGTSSSSSLLHQLPAPRIAEISAANEWTNDFHLNNANVVVGKPIVDPVVVRDHWADEFNHVGQPGPSQRFCPQRSEQRMEAWTNEFFDLHESVQNMKLNDNEVANAAAQIYETSTEDPEQFKYSEFMNFMKNVSDNDVKIENGQVTSSAWANDFATGNTDTLPDWVKEFSDNKEEQNTNTENYNSQFWNRLQDEWKKISEDTDRHPWLSEYTDYYDPYKEYTFDEENPMANMENALEKGKQFLAQGDVPSAVLCFESAVKQDPENPEIWELLGISQAENEKDPNAIAALKKSLELQPQNPNVLMALAVSYTNESLQNQALRALLTWLDGNQTYRHLVPPDFSVDPNASIGLFSHGTELKTAQDIFLKAVHQNHPAIDPDIQEALGVLFNLSSEYDKAVDCFRAAVQVRPDSAKTWNRLGASLANGNRSTEAVDAYQRALEIQPGFVRARYNVGIICINLKAYNEAAEHFLTALNHQATSLARSGLSDVKGTTNQMSDTIWSTLRMVISLMGRLDLQPAIDNRDLMVLNKAFELPE